MVKDLLNEKLAAEVTAAGVSVGVLMGWASIILALPAAAYYMLRIYNEFIKKNG